MAERGPVLAVAALTALIAAALLAGAASGLKTKSKGSAELAAKEDGGVRARCPKRGPKKMVSGGFLSKSPLGGPEAEFSTVAFFASRPSGRRGWTVRAANFDGDPTKVKAKALCARGNPRIETRTNRKRIPAGKSAGFTITCKRGEAIAGGFSTPRFAQDESAEVIAIESRRLRPRKWRFAAYNNSASKGGFFEGHVRCAKRRPGLVVHREVGTAFEQAGTELSPTCDEGEELWSGGFKGRYDGFDPFGVIVADRSYPKGDSWISRFVGYQSSAEVVAFAYCRP